MNFFRRLFGPANPTSGWPAVATRLLTLEIDSGRLNGVSLGAPLDDYAALGRGEALGSCDATEGSLGFFSRGVELEYRRGRVVSLVVWLEPEGRYAAFTGPLRHGGVSLTERDFADESTIKRRLGEPYWRDEDEDEVLLFYVSGESGCEIEIPRNQPARSINLLATSTLSDAEQRTLFGVTKPWPPEPAS